MLDYLLNEPIITALKARLAAELPAELTTRSSGLPAEEAAMLAAPAQILDFAPVPSMLTAFPTIGLLDEASDLEDDTGSTVTGLHRIGIVVYLASPDQRVLAWGLRRYAQAVMKVALRQRGLGKDRKSVV